MHIATLTVLWQQKICRINPSILAYLLCPWLDRHLNRLITGQLARAPGCDSVRGLARSGRQPLPVDGRQLAVQRAFQGCHKSSALILRSPAGCLLSGPHREEHMTPPIRGTSVKLKTDHSGLLAGAVCRSAIARNAILTRRSSFFFFSRAEHVWLSAGLSWGASGEGGRRSDLKNLYAALPQPG